MRIAKSDTVAGLPAPVARDLVRLYRGGTFVQELADTLLRRNGVEDTEAVFARMEKAGYLVKADTDDDPGYLWWEATTRGNALAMASFGKPVTLINGGPSSRRPAGTRPGVQRRSRDASVRGAAKDFRKLP
ncbi:hypothetical protein GCM10023346_47130 [Arthrobacter gyeryongensis]|uniref:Uncharacterized protein n=1 Tax=Arthrobacter gyeryongensis TaxID=1650592 RepID=A0ABP9SV86_9MICC